MSIFEISYSQTLSTIAATQNISSLMFETAHNRRHPFIEPLLHDAAAKQEGNDRVHISNRPFAKHCRHCHRCHCRINAAPIAAANNAANTANNTAVATAFVAAVAGAAIATAANDLAACFRRLHFPPLFFSFRSNIIPYSCERASPARPCRPLKSQPFNGP